MADPARRGLVEAGRFVAEHRDRLAARITDDELERTPALQARYGERGRRKCAQDNLYHLDYFASALKQDTPTLFQEYLKWAKVLLEELHIPAEDLAASLRSMRAVLEEELPPPMRASLAVLDDAIEALSDTPDGPASCIDPRRPFAALARRYLDLLLARERARACRAILDAVDAGTPIRDIYLEVFQPSLYEIGRLWQTNRISVAEEHYCTAATQLVIAQLYPRIFDAPRIGRRMIATCVAGELHELGVRMVADFFEMEGWDACYLGASTPADALVSAVVEWKPHLVAVSATLSTHIEEVAHVIARLRAEPGAAEVPILVGGNPFNTTPELWRRVGADGHAHTAREAIDVARVVKRGTTRA